MAEKNTFINEVGDLAGKVQDYIRLRLDLFKLELAEKVVMFVSSTVILVLIATFSFFILFFLSFAFAYWFAGMTGKWPLAFLLTAAIWVLVGLVIFLFRKPLILDQIARYTTQDLISEEESETQNNATDDF